MKLYKFIFMVSALILFVSFTYSPGTASEGGGTAAEEAEVIEYFTSEPNIRVGLIFGSGARTSFQTMSENGFILGEVRAGEPDVFYAQNYISNKKIAVIGSSSGLAVINPDSGTVLRQYAQSGNNLAIIAAKSPEFPLKMTELSSRTTGVTVSPANNSYTGAFIYRAGSRGIEVINLVVLDDYIKGVVPYEVSPAWEPEALSAFAITARSYAVNSILRNRHAAEGFAICNDVHCQLFIGAARATDKTNAAVDDTRALVLTYEGRVIEAVYHSSSGGATENHNDAWGGEFRYPYLAGVKLPFENYADPSRNNALWTNTVSPRELYDFLVNTSIYSSDFRGRLNSPVANITIDQRSDSNYIKKLTVTDSNGNRVSVEDSDRIRRTFNRYANSANMDIFRPNRLRAVTATASAPAAEQDIEAGRTYIMTANGLTRAVPDRMVVMSADGVNTTQAYWTGIDFVFDGRGWGHGVGMSQWAAQDMALLGYGYEDIVKTFYTGVVISDLTDVAK
ncbi:MAG: SpoIID/LytB domain-containing protein [Oscillospiraceae bacterium]|nr:SpoIID/LytB domain-containing protein [Oscillospiraceae bacterium]